MQRSSSPHSHLFSFFRGLFIGALGVFAIAVWAINLEVVLSGNAPGGVWTTLLRVVLCDAIPLATLLAIYRGIGRDSSAENIIRSIVSTFFGSSRGRKLAAEPLRFADEIDPH